MKHNKNPLPIPRLILFVICISLLVGCVSSQSNRNNVANSSANNRKIAELNTRIAIEHLKEKDYALALEKLDKATSTDPNYADAYNTRGIVYSQIGELEKAKESFERSLRIDSDNPLTLNNYGQFLCQNGEHANGQSMFERAYTNPLYRNPEIALSNAGTCALNQGETEKAEALFRQALEKDPRVAIALLQMASITYETGRYLPARGYLQRFSEVSRHVARSLWLGILVERELGDQDAEASYALSLEKNFPDSKEAGMLSK